jgi:hypothetical protein
MGAAIRCQRRSDAARRRDRGLTQRSDVQKRHQPADLLVWALSSGRSGQASHKDKLGELGLHYWFWLRSPRLQLRTRADL